MKNKIAVFLLCAFSSALWAQAIQEGRPENASIPLKKIVILTAGLAYYEHSGPLNGQANIVIPFRTNTVNDALKSLVINDPSSANPSIYYQSEQTLYQTLRSLKIDLSDNPGLAAMLERLKGEDIEIAAPVPLSGRIVGVEHRHNSEGMESWLLLNTNEGLKSFNLKEISAVSFKDPSLNQDLNRALDLIAASRNSFSRDLAITLPGSGRRNVSVSYVIPSPVWKVSYRLDLSADKPLFQGWAIVDNDSDTDWINVELSLVAGRPASFVQNLYPPYYVRRPTIPLAIAGTAAPAEHDQGFEMPAPALAVDGQRALRDEMQKAQVEESHLQLNIYDFIEKETERGRALAGGAVETAYGSEAGGQFEFTIKNPVSLDRRMSAMLPLVESRIDARKIIIYNGRGSHPRLGAELTNTSGMKLPAGPVTVYDGGVYGGDALIEFWNENEKRLISFGEDLSVTVMTSDTNSRVVSSVTVSGGVMTINRSIIYVKTYTFKNAGAVSKQLVVEHTKTAQDLVSPKADEQTFSLYRFNMNLAANRELVFTVTEQRPISETVRLLSIQPDAFLSYSSNQEIPSNVRSALQRAVDLRRTADAADLKVRDIETQRSRLASDQDRIRRNLEAAGSQTQQGQEYLRRLAALDGEIDALTPQLEKAQSEAKTARDAFTNYLNGLNLQ